MEFNFNKKDYAFGKDVWFLGILDGKYLWIEDIRFDCDWYYGIGYVETYTNKTKPSLSRDIDSHSHFNYLFKTYSDFLDNDNFKTYLSENDRWKIYDYLTSMYTLRKAADMFYIGNSHIAYKTVDISDKEMYDKCNEKIVFIWNEVKKILESYK